jgi:hypothetical protein
MTHPTEKKPPSGEQAVGYGKPPMHSRFRKGVSGNPSGGPRGMTTARAKALALKEAYRPVTVREGDKIVTLPAIQAVLRSQVALGAKGNGSAQRALIAAVQAIEQEFAAQAVAKDAAEAKTPPMSERELARRIAWILSGSVPKRSPEVGAKDSDETCPAGEDEER